MGSNTGPTGTGRYPRRSIRRRFHPVIVLLTKDMKRELDRAATAEGFDSRSAVIRAACQAFLTGTGEVRS